jgi:hypothetical protein
MTTQVATLSNAEYEGLCVALDDEYKAHSTYDQVTRDFGPIRPFVNIVEAELRHAQSLEDLLGTYGRSVPPNRWLGNAPRFSSVHEACVASIQGEIENIAIYDRVLKTTIRPDILSVYRALRAASKDRHLPAFERCAQRTV